jgi:hypothetical protein
MPNGRALQKPLPNGGLPASPSPTGHNKLGLKILISSGLWLAGETVSGALEIAVNSTELALGEVGIEFSGFEGELRASVDGQRGGHSGGAWSENSVLGEETDRG